MRTPREIKGRKVKTSVDFSWGNQECGHVNEKEGELMDMLLKNRMSIKRFRIWTVYWGTLRTEKRCGTWEGEKQEIITSEAVQDARRQKNVTRTTIKVDTLKLTRSINPAKGERVKSSPGAVGMK